MKKYLNVLMSGLLVLSMAACTAASNNVKDDEQMIGENVQIPNPWVSYDSIEEASKASGINLEINESFNDYSLSFVQVMDNSILEVRLNKDEDEISVRKANHYDDVRSIAGVYYDYEIVKQVEINGLEVTLEGNDDMISLAYYTNNNEAISVYFTNIAEEEAIEFIASIK